MRRLTFSFIALTFFFSAYAHAQMDQQYWANFQLMTMQIEQMQAQLRGISGDFVPAGPDVFALMLDLRFLSPDNVTIYAEMDDRKVELAAKHYSIVTPYNITTMPIFRPGMTISVVNRYTGEVYGRQKIPETGTLEYKQFMQIATQRLAMRGINARAWLDNYSQGKQNGRSRGTCSMCGGKGWIRGSKSVTYDSSTPVYCETCDGYFPPSHSHEACPSCSGF